MAFRCTCISFMPGLQRRFKWSQFNSYWRLPITLNFRSGAELRQQAAEDSPMMEGADID
ncbi:hypothetical protein O9929_05480 [Vibrio lentus]|nr:hypothetical protein [Vibrio lentus]